MTVQYKEKHRPQFHFSPKEKWMNDPNGMVFFNGEYHLFYQYHPHGTTWGPMHWGHAVSKDMVHWEELPIALYPDEHGAIFSGSAVVDWNNTTGFFENSPGLVAIFTHADNYPGTERPRQRQSLAYSKDDGRTWVTYEGNPVLSDVDITDYRDPKVFWHEESNKWVMVLATGQTVTIYTSTNLKEWEFASLFGLHEGSHDGVWECPDLFQLPIDGNQENKKWVMVVSIGDNPKFKEGSRTQYFVGDFDGTTFVNQHSEETVLWLDYGRDNYAGVSWSDIPQEDGRRIYIGWMSNWRYANQVPTKEWRSAMTLPRELSLTTTSTGLRIVQLPVAEINGIRGGAESFRNLALDGKEPISYKISELTEIEIEFEKETAETFGLSILHSKMEKTTISYDAVKEVLIVDRTAAGDNSFSESFATIQEAPLNMEGKTINLQVFLDASSIEVFANNGRIAVTSLIFPDEKADKVTLFSKEGTASIRQLTLTSLKSIWSM
ncbi:glycoside hydrolase family 32 protein [Sutcliffiella horikoshii]|uniref:glycoside hydrolase family 32 protein n=1 Tax=Sutcliffiella horikoshii TaxID=79883 RepID=UPI00384AD679